MRENDVERAVEDACMAELEDRGMHKAVQYRAERVLAPGITGLVSLFLNHMGRGRGGLPVAVIPTVGVRHDDASRLVSAFLGVKPFTHSQPSMSMENLVPDSILPPRWMVPDLASLPDAARRLADDVVFSAYPWMEGFASTEALIDRLAQPRWRVPGAYILAVLYMLDGRLDDAKQALMRKGLPKTQNPTTWSNEQFARFLDAFCEHFDVDLGVEQWPVRGPSKPSGMTVKIRDRGVVRSGLVLTGRQDLVSGVPGLTADQIDQIAHRAGSMITSRAERDVGKAVGLAAAEVLDERGK
jgi:hypothetical protein